uniref:Uncharacterized protein n=1 Tax=Sipha flava TaxID=143950 RepID=A0A2S2QJT8_9HEMI
MIAIVLDSLSNVNPDSTPRKCCKDNEAFVWPCLYRSLLSLYNCKCKQSATGDSFRITHHLDFHFLPSRNLTVPSITVFKSVIILLKRVGADRKKSPHALAHDDTNTLARNKNVNPNSREEKKKNTKTKRGYTVFRRLEIRTLAVYSYSTND